jgi:hypothetical protein
MLTADLSVNGSRATVTLPGASGALTFAQITGTGNSTTIKRRVSATAGTTPQTLSIGHEIKGKGFEQRIRSVVRLDFQALNTDIADTGGVTPSASAYMVIDRPVQSGGVISTSTIKDLVGQVCDVLTVTGQLDKFLNQEA